MLRIAPERQSYPALLGKLPYAQIDISGSLWPRIRAKPELS
jgi:hypothetical protein